MNSRLKRRHQVVSRLLCSLQHSPLTELMWKGSPFFLPKFVSKKVEGLESIPENELREMASKFGFKGCVCPSSDLSGCYLLVQSNYFSSLPFEFGEKFGGHISVRETVRGARHPVLGWKVCGERARKVASLLSSFPGLKQEELRAMLQWPKGGSNRRAARNSLCSLKESRLHRMLPQGVMSWRDLSFLFDACGYIFSTENHYRLRLEIRHPSNDVIRSVPRFLQGEGMPEIQRKVYMFRKGKLTWSCQKESQAILILQNMVQNGLMMKRQVAETTIENSQRLGKRERLTGFCFSSRRRYDRRGTEDKPVLKLLQDLRRAVYAREAQSRREAHVDGSQNRLRYIISIVEDSRHLSKIVSSLSLKRRDCRFIIRAGYFHPD